MQTLSQDGRWLPVIATSVDPATQADIHVLTLIDVVANTTDSRQIFSSQPTITSPLKFAPDGKNVAYRVVDTERTTSGCSPSMARKAIRSLTLRTIMSGTTRGRRTAKTLAVVRFHAVSDVILLRKGKVAP